VQAQAQVQEQEQEQEQEQAQQVWAERPPWALRVWSWPVVRWGRQRAWLAMRRAKGCWLAPWQQFAGQAFGRKA
jgi:hypothetical protein